MHLTVKCKIKPEISDQKEKNVTWGEGGLEENQKSVTYYLKDPFARPF
jgi:hypothetical protein